MAASPLIAWRLCLCSSQKNGELSFRAICDVFVNNEESLPPMPATGIAEDRSDYYHSLGMFVWSVWWRFC